MKRSLIVAAGVGALTIGIATPAFALWTNGANSNNALGYSKASKPGLPASVTAARNNGTNVVTVTITGAPTGGFDAGQGYRVVEDVSGAACTIGPVVGNSCQITGAAPGNKKYAITAFAGPWTATTSRICEFANGGSTSATCT